MELVNVSLFAKRIFPRVRVALNPMTRYLHKRQKRRPREDGGRDWRECSHKPRSTWRHQKLEETRKDPPLEPSVAVQTVDFGSVASRTARE